MVFAAKMRLFSEWLLDRISPRTHTHRQTSIMGKAFTAHLRAEVARNSNPSRWHRH